MSTSHNAQPGEPAPAKAAGFAPVARLASLGGFIRSHSRRDHAQTSEASSLADRSPELSALEDSGAAIAAQPGESNGAAGNRSSSVQPPPTDGRLKQHSVDNGKITVEIKVEGQSNSNEDTSPCKVILSMPNTDKNKYLAANSTPPQRDSRLNSLSGLFRASKPPHIASPSKPEEPVKAVSNTSSSTGEHPHASGPSSSTATQQQLTASSSSASLGQQRARWAARGTAAVSSLYGMVQHAAEAPLAHAGRAAGSLPGMRSHAVPQQNSSDKAADADLTLDIIMRIKTAASPILEVCQSFSILHRNQMLAV